MRTFKVRRSGDRWELWLREWYGGPDPPDLTFVRNINLEEAIRLVEGGASDDGSIAAVRKNALEGLAIAASEGGSVEQAKVVERKHTGYKSSCGCTYGLAYFACPEHGGQPIARVVRLTVEEPIDSPSQPDQPRTY